MTQTTQPIRFAVDFSVLAYLGLANYATKPKFLNFVPNGEMVYDNLIWLNNYIKYGVLELVVPYSVITGLREISSDVIIPDDKRERAMQNEIYKKYASLYMTRQPNVKVAFLGDGYLHDYLTKVNEAAQLYSEKPYNPDDMKSSYSVREKPFLYHYENVSFYARKIAEATMLGLDFLTFDYHYFSKNSIDTKKAIETINKAHFNSTVKPMSLRNAINILEDLNQSEIYIHKCASKPVFAKAKLMDFKSFKEKAHEVSVEKQENKKAIYDIIHTRTLFLKYLDKPLNFEQPSESTNLKLQTKKPLTTKIKFDLNSPDAKEILDNYFNKDKEIQNEKI